MHISFVANKEHLYLNFGLKQVVVDSGNPKSKIEMDVSDACMPIFAALDATPTQVDIECNGTYRIFECDNEEAETLGLILFRNAIKIFSTDTHFIETIVNRSAAIDKAEASTAA